MKGSIRQRSRGSWQIILDTGTGPNGVRRRVYETVRGRKGDAQRRLNELLVSLEKGIYAPLGQLTVGEHLHNWLEGYVKTNCSLRTLDAVQSIAENHLIPAPALIQHLANRY
ncbi:unnamed protein product [marine sediment metagenome]|uniref:Integrase SAM-like N-terminal domain-containing protein n=1 Tax=marine sediment metagenome TaxID=412755 RepID=X1KB97_9ZZZZ